MGHLDTICKVVRKVALVLLAFDQICARFGQGGQHETGGVPKDVDRVE